LLGKSKLSGMDGKISYSNVKRQLGKPRKIYFPIYGVYRGAQDMIFSV
jgi:hypothetical protein